MPHQSYMTGGDITHPAARPAVPRIRALSPRHRPTDPSVCIHFLDRQRVANKIFDLFFTKIFSFEYIFFLRFPKIQLGVEHNTSKNCLVVNILKSNSYYFWETEIMNNETLTSNCILWPKPAPPFLPLDCPINMTGRIKGSSSFKAQWASVTPTRNWKFREIRNFIKKYGSFNLI